MGWLGGGADGGGGRKTEERRRWEGVVDGGRDGAGPKADADPDAANVPSVISARSVCQSGAWMNADDRDELSCMRPSYTCSPQYAPRHYRTKAAGSARASVVRRRASNRVGCARRSTERGAEGGKREAGSGRKWLTVTEREEQRIRTAENHSKVTRSCTLSAGPGFNNRLPARSSPFLLSQFWLVPFHLLYNNNSSRSKHPIIKL
jgi:hypothetical protein